MNKLPNKLEKKVPDFRNGDYLRGVNAGFNEAVELAHQREKAIVERLKRIEQLPFQEIDDLIKEISGEE